MLSAVATAGLFGAGAGLELWALLELGWRRALDLPASPDVPRLVLGGPFRYVRHPQSLGLLLLLGGAAVAAPGAATWMGAALAGALVVAMAVRHDRELGREFGAAYARYRATVPLLIPRMRSAAPAATP